MRTPSPPYCGLDLAPPLADRFIMEVAPLDYGPVVLRMPFGFRLTADTLPSGCPRGQNPTVGASPWLFPSFPTSCPFRVRHGHVPQPARRYPRLWIRRPSSGRPRDLNPPDQNTAQHTIRDAPTPCRSFRRTSFPSLGDTTVSSLVRPRRPRTWAADQPGVVKPGLQPALRWRRQGLPSSRETRAIIRHVPPTPV
jgi:hypothetical protein